ncbi:hypothetical protein ACFSQ7_50265 [Paenibacillus rhizoplanae]
MKDNAEAAGGGVDQRQRLIHKMAGLESRYDSAICMLRSPFSSPGVSYDAEAGGVHPLHQRLAQLCAWTA